MCASSWLAMGTTRMRLVPGGTVGGRMPCSEDAAGQEGGQIFMVVSGCPTTTGTIGVSSPRASQPWSRRAPRRRAAWPRTRARRASPSSPRMRARAARAAEARQGGGAVEKT